MANAFIEKLAKIIEDVPIQSGDYSVSREDAIACVRAVLLAMREPSEEMVEAGYEAAPEAMDDDDGCSSHDRADVAPSVWQAMIDRALQD